MQNEIKEVDIAEESCAEPEKEKGHNFFHKMGEKAATLAGDAKSTLLHAVDKDGDGKFTRDDIGLSDENMQAAKEKAKVLATVAADKAQESATQAKQALAKAKEDIDRKRLRPVFAADFLAPNTDTTDIDQPHTLQLPKMVRIVEKDKEHSENPVCYNSVGFRSNVKGVDILNIFDNYVSRLGLRFYPVFSTGFYYADPYQDDFYISLDSYFSYMDKARVDELAAIAQDLGAKTFTYVFKEQRKTLVSSKAEVNAKENGKNASVEDESACNEYMEVGLKNTVQFNGSDHPKMPKLVYLKNDTDIRTLVEKRINHDENQLQSKIYQCQLKNSIGMNSSEAAGIDAALGQLKLNGSASISSEIEREVRTEIEYSITF